MGRDKALLDWHGRSLVDHALDRFRAAGIAEAVVSGDRPLHEGIPDAHVAQGPLAGLLAVAQKHPDARLLVVPVDMPRLPACWLATLASAYADAPALCFENSPLPLRLDVDAKLIALLSTWLDDPQGPRAVRHLLRALDAQSLASPDGGDAALDNANTPEEWIRIRQ